MLDNLRVILVNPSHPGNVGATARALKNMGISELWLLNPQDYLSPHATARASGATDILAKAPVVNTLQEAVAGCEIILGTSARNRFLEKPVLTPRECATTICAAPKTRFALLFGRERTGLTNEELSICHQQIIIPTNPEFSSLNLAAAVQLIAYELRVTALAEKTLAVLPQRELAAADQLLGFYQHLEKTLIDIKFIDPKQPKLLMQRLQRLFNRALLDKKEINILRGILTSVDRRGKS